MNEKCSPLVVVDNPPGPCEGPEVACNDNFDNDCDDCTDQGDADCYCIGKECGTTPCGQSCGQCTPGIETCNMNTSQCEASCIPVCNGKQCGPDGCGKPCGTCQKSQVCMKDGKCCAPQCNGKECGDDGCGGSCGNCLEGTICGTNGLCPPLPAANCPEWDFSTTNGKLNWKTKNIEKDKGFTPDGESWLLDPGKKDPSIQINGLSIDGTKCRRFVAHFSSNCPTRHACIYYEASNMVDVFEGQVDCGKMSENTKVCGDIPCEASKWCDFSLLMDTLCWSDGGLIKKLRFDFADTESGQDDCLAGGGDDVGIDWIKLTPGICQDGSTQSCYTGPANTKGIGPCKSGLQTCEDGQWSWACVGEVIPSPEVCDGLDNDCDGHTDDGNDLAGCAILHADVDGDGYGSSDSKCLCAPSGEYKVTNSGDCDDLNATIHPNSNEICGNGIDEDCNGSDLPCSPICIPTAETCDGKDNDCDNLTDEENATGCSTYFYDGDGDNYGTDGNSKCLCAMIAPYVIFHGDCDDNNPNINPAAKEICNGIDDNCGGTTDEGCQCDCNKGGFQKNCLNCFNCFRDNDGDKTGDSNDYECLCFCTTSHPVKNGDDCDDNDPTIGFQKFETCGVGVCQNKVLICQGGINTGPCQPLSKESETDICGDGLDNDCNGQTDENCGPCAIDDTPCDDLDPCTINDKCSNGECVGQPMICDDGDPCTAGDYCSAGVCYSGIDVCLVDEHPDQVDEEAVEDITVIEAITETATEAVPDIIEPPSEIIETSDSQLMAEAETIIAGCDITCPCGCVNGSCQPSSCLPFQYRCNGNTQEQCDPQGCGWQTFQVCPYQCVGGDCVKQCNGSDENGNGIIDDEPLCSACQEITLIAPAGAYNTFVRDWSCKGPCGWYCSSPNPPTIAANLLPGYLYRLNACQCSTCDNSGSYICDNCLAIEAQDGLPIWQGGTPPIITIDSQTVAVFAFEEIANGIIPPNSCVLVHDDRVFHPVWTANIVCNVGSYPAEWDCADGIDNDGDGGADCADPKFDCAWRCLVQGENCKLEGNHCGGASCE